MRSGPLIEGDEFVGLRPTQPTSAAEQHVQAVPLGAVGGDEHVEIHGALLLVGASA
jgi:hypothetical protein